MSAFLTLSKDEIIKLQQTIYRNMSQKAVDFFEQYGLPTLPADKKQQCLTHLTRLFLLSQNYNIPLQKDDLKPLVNNPSQLKIFATAFRKKANRYRAILEKYIENGIDLRHIKKTPYPKFLTKTDRLYVKIPTAYVGDSYIQKLIDDMNALLPKEAELSVIKQGTSFLIQTPKERRSAQPIGQLAGRFLTKNTARLFKIQNAFHELGNLSEATKTDFVNWFNTCHTHQEYVHSYPAFKKTHPDIFPRAYINATLFYQIKKHLGSIALKNVPAFIEATDTLQHFYTECRQALHDMQAGHIGNMQKQAAIDCLVFSKVPRDIALMSAYAPWEDEEWGHCMNPIGSNGSLIPKEIGLGSVIVYGINTQNPEQKLSRILLKPYRNQNGETYYGVSYMYGVNIPEIKEIIKDFLSPYQPPKVGHYKMVEGIYPDQEACDLYFTKTPEEFCDLIGADYEHDKDGTLIMDLPPLYTSSTKWSKDEEQLYQTLTQPAQNIRLDMYGLTEEMSFQNVHVMGTVVCSNVTKSTLHKLPQSCSRLELEQSNLRSLSSLHTNTAALKVSLTNRLKSLDGLPPFCRDVTFSRTKIKTKYFAIPHQVQDFSMGMSEFEGDTFDLSACTGEVKIIESTLNAKQILWPQKANFLQVFAIPCPNQQVLDFSGIDDVYFAPVTRMTPTEIKLNPHASKLQMYNIVFPATKELDLSQMGKASFLSCDFTNVQSIKLPPYASLEDFSKCLLPPTIKTQLTRITHNKMPSIQPQTTARIYE